MNMLNILSTSPQYSCSVGNKIGATSENSDFDLRFLRVKCRCTRSRLCTPTLMTYPNYGVDNKKGVFTLQSSEYRTRARSVNSLKFWFTRAT